MEFKIGNRVRVKKTEEHMFHTIEKDWEGIILNVSGRLPALVLFDRTTNLGYDREERIFGVRIENLERI